MGKLLLPFKIFVVGQIMVLLLVLVLPTIWQVTQPSLAVAGTEVLWGFNVVVPSVRLLVFLISELVILGAAALAFLKQS